MSLMLGLGLGLAGRAGGSTATYDPAVLAFTIWSKDDYGGVPWAGEASAGTSGSNSFSSSGGTAPVAGTAVDGKTPMACGGSGAGYVTASIADTSIWAAGAGSIIVLCKPTTGLADPANTISARGIVGVDSSGVFQMGFSDAGLRVSVYDGAYQETPAIAAATGSWHCFAARYNGTAVQASKNASPFASNSTAAGGATRVGAGVRVGSNFDNSKEFIGDIMQIILCDFAISDAENAGIHSYFKARYPSMGLP